MRRSNKSYIVVNEESKENSRYIEGAFPLTEEGKKAAEEYAKKLSIDEIEKRAKSIMDKSNI